MQWFKWGSSACEGTSGKSLPWGTADLSTWLFYFAIENFQVTEKLNKQGRKKNIHRSQMQGDVTSSKNIYLKKSILFSNEAHYFFFKFFPQNLNKQLLKMPAFAWKVYFIETLLQQPEITSMTRILTIFDLKKCPSIAETKFCLECLARAWPHKSWKNTYVRNISL